MSQPIASEESIGSDPPDTTVLFVDDEPEILELLELLTGDEYETRTATSGEAALQAIGPEVDLVFLDRQMPGLNGREVLRQFRGEGYRTPVAILSAVEPDRRLAGEYETYLRKPVSRDQVRATIERYT
jgi:CheY-like chemotaxis protein